MCCRVTNDGFIVLVFNISEEGLTKMRYTYICFHNSVTPKKHTAFRNTPWGRGGPPICYGLLHGGGRGPKVA